MESSHTYSTPLSQTPSSFSFSQQHTQQVKSILDQSHQRAKSLLSTHKADLDLIAKALLEHETLTGPEIIELLKGKKLKKAKLTTAPPPAYTPPSPATPPSGGGILKGRGLTAGPASS